MKEGAITAGKADTAGKTGADNTGMSRTMTGVLAVSAADGSATAAAESDGAPIISDVRGIWGLKNPRILESSTCKGSIMSAMPPASGDVDGAPRIDVDGAELGCKKFCKGFPPPTPGAKFEDGGLDNKAVSRA